MGLIFIGLASLFVSLLTFFTGFGLGTILMPVFAIFFPVNIAIAITAIVHLMNNFFKAILIGRKADKQALMRFGIPAIIGAFIGAQFLVRIAGYQPLFSYQIGSTGFFVTLVKLLIALLLIGFVLLELIPGLKAIEFDKNKMGVGGFLSGFFWRTYRHSGSAAHGIPG